MFSGVPNRLRECLRLGVFCALFPLFSATSFGQLFETKAGSSSLLGTHGGTLAFDDGQYKGSVSVGWHDGPQYGFLISTPVDGFALGLGDQMIPFVLPTDLFNASYYFLGRGVSLTRRAEAGQAFLFAGATSQGIAAPFVRLASAESAAGAVFWNRSLSQGVSIFTFNVISRELTSIHSIAWKTRDDLSFAVSGGAGNHEPYGAVSLEYKPSWLHFRASYTEASAAFRRVRVQSPALSESFRENLSAEIHALKDFGFIFNHQNIVAPVPGSPNGATARVDGVSAWAVASGFRLHGTFNHSVTPRGAIHAVFAGAQRSIGGRFEASADYLYGAPSIGKSTSSVLATLRERISQRLKLSQSVSLGCGQRNVSLGADFASQRIDAGIGYATVFLPFFVPGQPAFRQLFFLHLRVQLPHDTEVIADTNVTPLGQVRYTAFADTITYRASSQMPGSHQRFSISPYVIFGRVEDSERNPVRGAAIQVCEETVFTDSNGEFLAHRIRREECSLRVLPEEFLFPPAYELVSAPPTAKADVETASRTIRIVLRSRANAPVNTPDSHP